MQSRIDKRGRVLIPKPLRDRLGWVPGTVLEFRQQGNQLYVKAVQKEPATAIKGGCRG